MVYHDFLPSFKNARINLSASKAMPRICRGQTNKNAGVMVRFLRASMASGCGISQVRGRGFSPVDFKVMVLFSGHFISATFSDRLIGKTDTANCPRRSDYAGSHGWGRKCIFSRYDDL